MLAIAPAITAITKDANVESATTRLKSSEFGGMNRPIKYALYPEARCNRINNGTKAQQRHETTVITHVLRTLSIFSPPVQEG